MSIDKAVDSALLDNALAATAEKIREKTGSTEDIAFDMEKGMGFADAVGAIQAGGGGGNEDLTALVNGTLTDFVAPEGVGGIRTKLFSGATALKTADLKNVTINVGVEAFDGCSSLESVIFPDTFKGITLLARAFRNCTKLQNVQTPMEWQATSATPGIFMGCTSLKRVDMPNCFNSSPQFFSGCTSLEYVRLKRGMGTSQAFYNCAALKTLVLTHDEVSALSNPNTFGNTPFASGGTGGTVYVPQALIESYKTATNWSTLYAAGTVTFLPIEGSEYE